VLSLDPAHAAALNGLAYALAYQGDLAGARTALETARRFYPADPNVLDSLGEVHYLRATFAEAARYFRETYRQDANFQGGVSLYKAAWAEWRAGKTGEAENTMRQFLTLRDAQRDVLVPLRRALWLHERGQTAEGERVLAELSAQASAPTELRAVALAQQAIWRLLAGDGERAQALAQQAAPLAQLPLSRSVLGVLGFLLQPPAGAAEWRTRAQQAFGRPGQEMLRERALGYGLLLDRRWPEAALQWRAIAAQQDAGSGVRPNVLAAWALSEAGQTDAARQALALVPLPSLDADLFMESMLFPRDLELRRRLGMAGKEPGSA
jgi:Tfp pilus assembly protein PilF